MKEVSMFYVDGKKCPLCGDGLLISDGRSVWCADSIGCTYGHINMVRLEDLK